MRPDVTFLTSSELQAVLGEPLDADAMDDLQRFRDRVMDNVNADLEALDVMVELYGAEWHTFDLRIWVVEGIHDPVSSPIILPRGDIEEAVFDAYRLLATQLIRGEPPASDMAAEGYDRLDALATALATTALERTMDADAFDDLMDAVADDPDDIKRWRAVDDIREAWDPDADTLHDWVEQHG